MWLFSYTVAMFLWRFCNGWGYGNVFESNAVGDEYLWIIFGTCDFMWFQNYVALERRWCLALIFKLKHNKFETI